MWISKKMLYARIKDLEGQTFALQNQINAIRHDTYVGWVTGDHFSSGMLSGDTSVGRIVAEIANKVGLAYKPATPTKGELVFKKK